MGDFAGESVLHWAIRKKYYKIVSALIKYGAEDYYLPLYYVEAFSYDC